MGAIPGRSLSTLTPVDTADQAGIRSTVIEQSLADYAELMASGFGDEDTSALIRLKRNR